MEWCQVAFKAYILFVSCDFVKNDDGSYMNVSMASAKEYAEFKQQVLPSPELVDAIYEQSTCQVYTLARDPASADSMKAQSDDVLAKASKCAPGSLIADQYKSVVTLKGQTGIYGWRLRNGYKLQSFFAGHEQDYVDYSQALRVVQSIALDTRTKLVVDTAAVLSE